MIDRVIAVHLIYFKDLKPAQGTLYFWNNLRKCFFSPDVGSHSINVLHFNKGGVQKCHQMTHGEDRVFANVSSDIFF